MFQNIEQLLKNNLSLTSKNDITGADYHQAYQSLKSFLSQENDELSLKRNALINNFLKELDNLRRVHKSSDKLLTQGINDTISLCNGTITANDYLNKVDKLENKHEDLKRALVAVGIGLVVLAIFALLFLGTFYMLFSPAINSIIAISAFAAIGCGGMTAFFADRSLKNQDNNGVNTQLAISMSIFENNLKKVTLDNSLHEDRHIPSSNL